MLGGFLFHSLDIQQTPPEERFFLYVFKGPVIPSPQEVAMDGCLPGL